MLVSLSSTLVLSKSKFIAYASRIHSQHQLEPFLAHINSNYTLKRASHLIYAYRTPTANGAHDGGERGAGERLARLLEMRGERDVVVLVVRWYGGVKLGSERWRCISDVAKQALDGLHSVGPH